MSTSDEIREVCARMIARDGVAKLSLRKIADQVGIKAPSIYEHFDSKESLLSEVRRAAAADLRLSLLAHAKGITPHDRLLGMATGYLAFASQQPALFALFFMALPSARPSVSTPVESDSPYAVLLALVKDVVGDASDDVETVCFGIWALVHGAAVLRQTHLQHLSAGVDAATRNSLEVLIDGWLARLPTAPRARKPRARARVLGT